jgi:ribokinase
LTANAYCVDSTMILVAGSANLDFVVRAPHIPTPGETVLGWDFRTFPGGKGANQAVACARAGGAPTHLLLALGNDAFAVPLEESLQAAGVHVHCVRSHDLATGTAFICVSDNAENAITVAPGANLSLRPQDLPILDGFTHLLLQLETPTETVTAYAKAARAEGVKVVLNAAPAQHLAPELLSQIDVLIVNEGELAVVSGFRGNVAQCLARIDVPCVVVTLGHRGCCARSDGVVFYQTAFDVAPIDSTGAGDTFCGTLVAALSQGSVLQQALRIASAAGALACTRIGAQSSIPTQDEVIAFLRSQMTSTEEQITDLRRFCGFSIENP